MGQQGAEVGDAGRLERRRGPAALFLGLSQATTVQFFRYTLVGGLAFVVDFVALYVLQARAGMHYLVAASLAFLLGLVTNYSISVRWIFSGRRLRSRTAEFTVYALIGVGGLALNAAIMWALTSGAGVHYLASKLASTVLVYLWNFFARKYTLFNPGS